MVSILVTGANRGIGLGLVRQLVQEPTTSIVIATARDVGSAKDLLAIISPKLHLVQLEITNDGSIARAVVAVASIVGDDGLDILVNNAGILVEAQLADADLSRSFVLEQLEVNTVAPLMMANKFRPLLKQAAEKKRTAQIANISATLGSLEMAPHITTPMPTAIYAMSKAALNMLTRKLAVEWKKDKIRATSFCPGWLDESTVPLAKLILSLSDNHNGGFYSFEGDKIPW